MAQAREPVSEDALEELREKIQEQREVVRAELAEDLGGEPEDYDAERYFEQMDGRAATDGGE
ncbi:MAG: hypothetical protein BRD21_01745 [Halobacteriales archaeon SW_8_66_22]|nr:MAG: hypothetical protein BRD21_01745 [Halobacteriales archaeon SW_8_66_22]